MSKRSATECAGQILVCRRLDVLRRVIAMVVAWVGRRGGRSVEQVDEAARRELLRLEAE